jgi:cytochrome P450
VAVNAPAVVDLRDPRFWIEPLPLLRAARARGRTALTQTGEPVLLRADDVELAHADARFANPGVANLEQLGIRDGPFYAWRRRTLAALDGDEHQQLRAFIGRLFTPRQTARIREGVRAHAAALLEGREELDVVRDYALDLPLWAICRFLGIPDADREELAGFLVGTEEGFSAAMTPQIRARAETSIVALHAYVERLVERCGARGGDDALSELVAAGLQADGIARADFIALLVNILGGAVGSTRAALANSLFLLLAHPGQARLLRREPRRIRAAVEECLRLFPPFRVGRRVARQQVEAFGLELEPGASVFVWRAAANRDPERFADPDRFDIARQAQPHASFGHGPHFCLGQALARVELQEAVLALIGRFPAAELLTREPERVPFTMDEKIVSLRVRLGPPASPEE